MTRNRLILILLFAFIYTGFTSMLQAQEITGEIKLGKEITLHSDILDQDRQLFIYKPKYKAEGKKGIPVLYVLDGSTHFHYTTGIVSFLSQQGLIPPVMVVAIKNINRNIDFTPVPADGMKKAGGASDFHAFIDEELIPFIEKKFYVSDYRILMGHSLGGTFATYSLLFKPATFDAYISISPYLQYADGLLAKKAAKNLLGSYEEPKYLFMTLGDEPDYTAVHNEFINVLEEKDPSNFHYKYKVMKKENHSTVPFMSIYMGLQNIFNDYQLPQEKLLDGGLAALDAHNAYISNKYDMEIHAGEQDINLLGYAYINAGRFPEAIKTLTENTKRYPKSANVYDSLGDAYRFSGNLKEALKNYEKAVKIAEKEDHIFLETYRKNMKTVKKEMKDFSMN